MSWRDGVHSDPRSGASELHSTIDGMLRSGLLKVYPLPIECGAVEEKFRQLLGALEDRCRKDDR